ncbi:MAG: PQQ-binding-like beta-propeller repeat protein [Candidatus Baltobacteraceae bacterium]
MRRPFVALAAVLLLAGGLAALATQRPSGELGGRGGPQTWTQYQGGPAHNAVFEGSLRANWLTPLGEKINGGLALAGGTLYAVSFDHKLYALDPASGAIRWNAATDNILMSTPVIADGIVVVGTGKDGFLKPDDPVSQVWGREQGDDLVAYTEQGRRLWSFHTAGENMASPAIDGGTLYFANGGARAYALDLHTGDAGWSVPLPGIATMASATQHAGAIITSVCHNAPYYCRTIALNERTGEQRWSSPIGGSDCTPTIDGGLVFVQSSSIGVAPFHTGGRVTVAALDERTGKTRWAKTYPPAPFTYIASSERQIAGTAVNGVLYQAIGNLARMVAFDERTGRERWSAHTSGNVKMSPVVSSGRVYFGDTAGIFYTLDARTGRIVHTGSFLQPFSVSPPVIYGKTLFVADGNMVAAMPLDTLQ